MGMELLFSPHAHTTFFPCSAPLAQFSSPPSRLILAAAARRRKNKSSTSIDNNELKIITIGRLRKSRRNKLPPKKEDNKQDYDDDGDENNEAIEDSTIPEVVTNRMMTRVGVSVGVPVALGIGFFPLFYYLKVVAKVDVPNWIPFGVSFIFLGTAVLGVSYGIVSASWDPLREGSFLGWNEARRNWPLFWESLWGRRG